MTFQLPALRRARPLLGAVGLAVVVAFAPVPSRAQETVAPWLRSLNIWRANVGLPAIVENPVWVEGLREHSNYLVELGAVSHQQDPNRPGATAEGAKAGGSSVVIAWSYSAVPTESSVIAEWVRAPFHAVHLFEPRFQRSAYGEARQSGRLPVDGAAALDVLRGVGPKVRIDRPITFPGDGTSVPLTDFTAEVPDPLTSCPGYAAPTGLPLLALFPEPVTSSSAELRVDGVVVPSCLIDQRYVNPDAQAQDLVRGLLRQKNAVVIVPRFPLLPGSTYEASVASSAGILRWGFRVDPAAGPSAGRPITITSARKTTMTAKAAKSSQ